MNNMQIIKKAEQLADQNNFKDSLQELRKLPEISINEYVNKIKISKKPSKDKNNDINKTRKLNGKLSTIDYLDYDNLLDALLVNIASLIDDDKCDLENNVISNLNNEDLDNANNVIHEFMYDTDIDFKPLTTNKITIDILRDNVTNEDMIINNVYSFDAFDIHNVSKDEFQQHVKKIKDTYKKL